MDGGLPDVPYFTDNFTDDSGVIHIPGTATEYWRHNLNVDNDAVYEIISHEPGYFVHHNLVERFSHINMCYNKLPTGTHTTWTTEPGQLPVKLPYISAVDRVAQGASLHLRIQAKQSLRLLLDSYSTSTALDTSPSLLVRD